MRLLFISFAALMFAGFILIMTRFWGLSQGYQAFEHPFLEAPVPWESVKVWEIPEAEALLSKHNSVVFWLDLAKTKDGYFLILKNSQSSELSPENLKENFQGDQTFFYDLQVLRLRFEKAPLLDEFLEKFPNSRFILNIKDNALDVHTALLTVVDKFKAADRVLFQSDIERVIKSIKELKPRGLYGTSRSDIMRLLTFESMWLVSASPFVGDIFIAPMKVLGRPAFNSEVLTEVRRRKKLIMLGPLLNEQEVVDARSLKPDGYIYESSELFLRELDQNPAQ